MLDSFRSSVLSVCLLSTAVSVCLMICPDNALKKQVKFLLSLLFVISLAMPFRDFRIPSAPGVSQQEQADRTVLHLTEQTVRETLETLLAEKQIFCREIQVNLHIDSAGCISITDIRVCCDQPQEAEQLLHEVLGEGVAVDVSQNLE